MQKVRELALLAQPAILDLHAGQDLGDEPADRKLYFSNKKLTRSRDFLSRDKILAKKPREEWRGGD